MSPDLPLFTLIGLPLLAVGALVYIRTQNALMRDHAKVQEAWAGIEVQLVRRHDLIPALVRVARAALAHESGVVQQLADLRAQAVAAVQRHDKAAIQSCEQDLSRAMAQVVTLIASLPPGTATANLALLQRQIEETEDQIAAARRLYNGNVAALNARIAGFPGSLMAAGAGVQAMEYDRSPLSVADLTRSAGDLLDTAWNSPDRKDPQ